MTAKVVHCCRDYYDVYVGRGKSPLSGKVEGWGNPFSHQAFTRAEHLVATRDEAVTAYEEWLKSQPALMARLPELRGKVLGCWCSPQSCHGDVLLRLANADS